MTQDIKPRVRVPATARAGDIVTIKTMITHVMETGRRKDAAGALVPRWIINRFTCDFNGVTVIDVTLQPAVSANPFLEFAARVDMSGEFVFAWYDDNGSIYTDRHRIEVS